MAKIAVLGNGSWGSVLGSMLADNGNDVVLYGNIDSVNQEINEHHTNTHYMKNWKLNPNVPATGDLEKALDGAEIVLFVLPTKAVRIVAKNVRKILDKTGATPLLVTATKGIEPGSSQDFDNRHFVNIPCNYELAKITEYTKDKTPEQISNEITHQ